MKKQIGKLTMDQLLDSLGQRYEEPQEGWFTKEQFARAKGIGVSTGSRQVNQLLEQGKLKEHLCKRGRSPISYFEVVSL